jgi:hypothetical protein
LESFIWWLIKEYIFSNPRPCPIPLFVRLSRSKANTTVGYLTRVYPSPLIILTHFNRQVCVWQIIADTFQWNNSCMIFGEVRFLLKSIWQLSWIKFMLWAGNVNLFLKIYCFEKNINKFFTKYQFLYPFFLYKIQIDWDSKWIRSQVQQLSLI